MHSRIFQISKNPIKKEDYFSADRYYAGEHEHFVDTIADYVDDDTNRNSDIQWLKECLGSIVDFNTDENGNTLFTINNKLDYFQNKFTEFKKLLQQLENITLEDFAGYGNMKIKLQMYRIQESYSDKYDFYMDDNHENLGLVPLDEFLRSVNEGDTFYIGASVDYHF